MQLGESCFPWTVWASEWGDQRCCHRGSSDLVETCPVVSRSLSHLVHEVKSVTSYLLRGCEDKAMLRPDRASPKLLHELFPADTAPLTCSPRFARGEGQALGEAEEMGALK